MANVILHPEWHLKEKEASPESVYWSRKQILRGFGTASLATILSSPETIFAGPRRSNPNPSLQYDPSFLKDLFPPKRSRSFSFVRGRTVTPEIYASSYNNYYEFTERKEDVWKYVSRFRTRPWTIKIGGLVKKPRRYDLEFLIRKFSLEERVYRFRCVEAWSMILPWVGIPLQKLIRYVEPHSKARYLSFIGWNKPSQAHGQRYGNYSWPYYEALRMDEAVNELPLLVVGMYGHPLTKQNGAPVRLIVPWKYGFKSMKGITRIEFSSRKPHTFWNDAVPKEYGFYANVNPKRPHPRWSQAYERVLGERRKIRTLPYNGYGKWVAKLYKNEV